MLAIDHNASLPLLPDCARVDEHRSCPFAHPLEKYPHHSARSRALDPARFAVAEGGLVRVKKQLHQLVRFGAGEIERRSCNVCARHETRDFPRCWSKTRFVEVVQVKVGQAVVALKAAEVFKMKISACPNERTVGHSAASGSKVFPIQMRGAAKEREGRFAHLPIFERESLRLAPRAEALDPSSYFVAGSQCSSAFPPTNRHMSNHEVV